MFDDKEIDNEEKNYNDTTILETNNIDMCNNFCKCSIM
jgi:hypothetical protein